MSSNRALNRFLVGASALAFAGAPVAGCESNASRKHPVPNGIAGNGAAGADGGADGNAGGGAGGEPGAGSANAGADAIAGMGGEAGATRSRVGAAGETAEAGAGGAAGGDCTEAIGSRIVIAFDALDAERVTNLQWTGSDSTTPNLAAAGGQLLCGDPLEFFGQAYGAEATLPAPIVAGDLATLVQCGLNSTITSAQANCNQAAQFPVSTQYRRYTGAQSSQMRVTRTFGFGASAAVFPQTILRAFVPRLPLAAFSSVVYPNQANTAVTTGTPGVCPTDCLIPTGTTWSGRWYADVDPTSGLAMIVLRDPSLTSAVSLAINNDGLSGSNLSAFLLLAPSGGWLQPITEVEYLCFADLVSWPQAQRDAATLPAGCGP